MDNHTGKTPTRALGLDLTRLARAHVSHTSDGWMHHLRLLRAGAVLKCLRHVNLLLYQIYPSLQRLTSIPSQQQANVGLGPEPRPGPAAIGLQPGQPPSLLQQ